MSDPARPYHLALAGALLGAAAGDVLLALNPPLFTLAGSVRLVGGAALLGALAAAPLLLSRPRSARPSRLFWLVLGGLLAGVAALAESQRTLYYTFLGNGTRRLLVAVTAIGLLGAAASAALSVRRPAGRGARGSLAALLALFLAVPAIGRRQPAPALLSPPEPLPRAGRRSVLVVAVEGVSWELLSRLASDGRLPVTARLLSEGAAGPLASLAPYDGAALWTTAATGKRPSRHGVVSSVVYRTPLGELRLLPRLLGLPPPDWLPFSKTVPLAPGQRRSLYFWEILASRGHEAAVLNWPAAEPARDGLVLWGTEKLFTPEGSSADGRPASAAGRARLLRVEPDGLDRPLERMLVPPGLDPEAAGEAAPLDAAALDLSVVGATLTAVPAGSGSISTLRLSGLARPARRFGPSAEPNRYWGPQPRDADARVRALVSYYRFLDDTLGDLLATEGRDRTLCVFSPVGYGPPGHTRALLELVSGGEPRASPEASRDGFVVFWGSGIRSGVRLTSAAVWDVAPTLLVLSGEPIARDIDGRVLGEVFDERFTETESVPVITTFEPGGPQ